MEKPNYYSIIPANVRYSNRLNANEKLLYSEITALSNKHGMCWSSNNYFAELYNVSPQAISKWINNLKKQGFITVFYEYKQGTKEVEKRIISVVEIQKEVSTYIDTYQQPFQRYQQKTKDNIKIDNNTREENLESHTHKIEKTKTKSEIIIEKTKTFYEKEFENIPANPQLIEFKKQYRIFIDYLFGENDLNEPLINVLSIEKQVTFEQYIKLLDAKSQNKKSIASILIAMENDNKYTKTKKNLYITLNNWIVERFKK